MNPITNGLVLAILTLTPVLWEMAQRQFLQALIFKFVYFKYISLFPQSTALEVRLIAEQRDIAWHIYNKLL